MGVSANLGGVQAVIGIWRKFFAGKVAHARFKLIVCKIKDNPDENITSRNGRLLPGYTGPYASARDVNQSRVNSADSTAIIGEIWVDNWFALFINGVKLMEDSTAYHTERSFNAQTGALLVGTSGQWRCAVAQQAPVLESCAGERSPQVGSGACASHGTAPPSSWASSSFDDSGWAWAQLGFHNRNQRMPSKPACCHDERLYGLSLGKLTLQKQALNMARFRSISR